MPLSARRIVGPVLQRRIASVLLIALGLELMEALRVFASKHQVRLQILLALASFAVAPHVIHLDIAEVDGSDIPGIAALIAALAVGRWLLRRQDSELSRPWESTASNSVPSHHPGSAGGSAMTRPEFPASHRLATTLVGALLGLGLIACKPNTPTTGDTPPAATATQGVTAEQARAIAKEAYVWGFPMVESYKTMHAQALEPGGPDFRAPFNQIGNAANVFTPKDTSIVTPNSDTPYSFLWMDLRAEPVVLTIPAIDPKRYFSVQLIDMYTYNFDYINAATTHGKAGSYLIAGPDWKGETPKGVEKVIRSETQFAYGLIRTQLFAAADMGNVKALQAQYKAQPLSAFLGTPAAAPAAAVDFPAYDAKTANALGFFSYLNFLLQFAPVNASEAALRERFASVGIRPGQPFDEAALSPQIKQALLDGIADANQELDTFKKAKVNTQQVSSADLFGTRQSLKDNYLYRFAGAKMGIYGNSGSEADYQSYFVDANGHPLDASKHDYTLHFAKDGLPPTNAFWSMTMYDGKSQLLVDNPINRYLLNSPMLPQLKRDADGGLTFYLQHSSPGKDKESNWLPAPNGPFYAMLRNYGPAAAVVDRSWKRPQLQPTR